MCEVAAQGAGGTSSTSRGANIEGDADNPVSKELVDTFALLVDQSSCTSLVLVVEVALTAEVALKGGWWLLRTKGRWKGLHLVSSSARLNASPLWKPWPLPRESAPPLPPMILLLLLDAMNNELPNGCLSCSRITGTSFYTCRTAACQISAHMSHPSCQPMRDSMM